MKFLLVISIFFTLVLAAPAAAQTEEQGDFDLNQNPLAPGDSPVFDQRLAPAKDSGGIALPQANSDLPPEAAIAFGDKKKKSPTSKDFIFGFISGSILISFVAFFMLKFAKQGG